MHDYETGETWHGWQHETTSRVERHFTNQLLRLLAEHEQALLRSQNGAGMARVSITVVVAIIELCARE